MNRASLERSGSGAAPDHDGGAAERGLRGFAVTAVVLVIGFVAACLAKYDVGGVRSRLDAYYALWPQEWSFFVALDTDLLDGYRITPGTSRLHEVYAPERQDPLWGLDRNSYELSAEIREIALRVPDRYWQACDRAYPEDCGATMITTSPYRMRTPVRSPSLCGLVVVSVERVAVPAPGRLPTSPGRAHHLAVVDVACGG
ncbi:hypothetical protein [Actinosynnema sp. NPDC020468]|uniref:hypothetical protein n=1 Tax=Actinosynnema sp. NPDC020468 TaxID=3154488 RepID=UPI0033F096D9